EEKRGRVGGEKVEGEGKKKEQEKSVRSLSGTLEGRELGDRREEKQVGHGAKQSMAKLRDLEGQEEEVRQADDIQEDVGKTDRRSVASAPPEKQDRRLVERERGRGRPLRPEERERRDHRRNGEDEDVSRAKTRRQLDRTLVLRVGHVTSRRRSPRRKGAKGGAPSTGIASSRASASRIRAR